MKAKSQRHAKQETQRGSEAETGSGAEKQGVQPQGVRPQGVQPSGAQPSGVQPRKMQQQKAQSQEAQPSPHTRSLPPHKSNRAGDLRSYGPGSALDSESPGKRSGGADGSRKAPSALVGDAPHLRDMPAPWRNIYEQIARKTRV